MDDEPLSSALQLAYGTCTAVRVTVKLAPSSPSADGWASGWPVRVDMVIAWPLASATVRCSPSSVVVAPVIVTEPKLSSGSTLLVAEDGASSIHSADDNVDW